MRAIWKTGPLGRPFTPLAQAGETGVAFQQALGAGSLEEMRAVPVETILAQPRSFMSPVADSAALPADPAAPLVSDVPLMLGLVLDESSPRDISDADFATKIAERYGAAADDFRATYPQAPRDALRQEAADRTLLQLADFSRGPAAPRAASICSAMRSPARAAMCSARSTAPNCLTSSTRWTARPAAISPKPTPASPTR